MSDIQTKNEAVLQSINATATAGGGSIGSTEELMALLASGKITGAAADMLRRAAMLDAAAASPLKLDDWGQMRVGQVSKISLPCILAILEAEYSDEPLSAQIATHLSGYRSCGESCTNLKNNPPRYQSGAKKGEPIVIDNDAFLFKGLGVGGSTKAADANVKRLQDVAAKRAAFGEAAKLVADLAIETAPAAEAAEVTA